jgi:hypothetical protein
MVLTKYAPADAPQIGKGRWTWQILSLKDKKLIEGVIRRGMQLQEELAHYKTESPTHGTCNPQTLWKSFKEDIKTAAKKHSKSSRSRIEKQIGAIQKDMSNLTNHPNLDTNESICYNEAFLACELEHLENT